MVGTLNFILRAQKALKDGRVPVYITYSIARQRVLYAMPGIRVFPPYWDEDLQRAQFIPAKDARALLPLVKEHELLTLLEVKSLNQKISEMDVEIDFIEQNFIRSGIAFSSQDVINLLRRDKKTLQTDKPTTRKEEAKGFIYEYINRYIAEHSASREAGSLSVYKSVKNHLQAYERHTAHRITFNSIDFSFFNKFQTFLINRKKVVKEGNEQPMLNNTTIAKALSTLKTFLGYARREGIKVNDSYQNFLIKREKLEVIALTQSELDDILALDLTNDRRLDKTRDVFVFSCATGFRYSDVAQLTREHISNDTITLIVKKTKSEINVPLNAISDSILNKYISNHRPLPVISNQNLNYYIKDLCKKAGIDKPMEIVRFSGKQRITKVFPKYELVHFHTGRKTFVTLSLEKGMSAEEVMEITGHTDYKSFKRYVNITNERKKVVMLKAWGDIQKLKIV